MEGCGLIRCAECNKPLTFANRINYGDKWMCPACVYEEAPVGSPVRWQMEHNYPDEIKKPAEKRAKKIIHLINSIQW